MSSAGGPVSPAAALDQRGFVADDYDWLPVARRARDDGWSVEKQRQFIAVLADTGIVEDAARAVGMDKSSAYKLRRSPGAQGFARAWGMALQAASQTLADLAFDRAINGVEVPVLDASGICIYRKRVFNDRLLMFLLRSHQPQVYGPDAGRIVHHPKKVRVDTLSHEMIDFVDRKVTRETTLDRGGSVVTPPGFVCGPDVADALDALLPCLPDDPLAAMPQDACTRLIEQIDRHGLDSIDEAFDDAFDLAELRAEQRARTERAERTAQAERIQRIAHDNPETTAR